LADVPVGHPDFGKAIRCTCQANAQAERRRSYLLRIDGLTDQERALRFGVLERRNNGPAIDVVTAHLMARRGMVTLTGKPGLGKSALLICAVNAAREAGVPAVYTTVTDLLDYLKAAYNPHREGLDFDDRWDLLVRADVLALDELDEFNSTPWAMERFLRLIDERWRRMESCLTLLATNSRVNSLPDKVASRLRDGRAVVLEMAGPDMRPFMVGA
jgi:DNA replication protein DnaC